MDEKTEIKQTLMEIEAALRKKGVPDYFIGCTSTSGDAFSFICKGSAGDLMSRSLEIMFSADPETVRRQITKLLKNVAEWYDFDNRISKTVH